MENIVLYIILISFALIFMLNVIATIMVLSTYFIVKNRRYYQIAFVWLIPFIGAFMFIYFTYEEYFNPKRKDEIGNNPNITDSDAVSYASASNYNGSR